MIVGVPREVHPGERRVALTPESAARLIELGFEVRVEARAGEGASHDDASYEAVGAHIVADARELWSASDLVLKVEPPELHPELGVHESELLEPGAHLISFLWPAQNEELVSQLATRKATVIAMDQVPRISRAQAMDALSSMANIAGYRAVVEAAHAYGRFFTGQITAAGRLPPAKVLIIGAGVAGLQAIATARAMGAIVYAFDTREAVREQVQSLGAEFLEVELEESGDGGGGYAKVMSQAFIDAEMALFRSHAPELDIVITTALIPGRPAPKLWQRDAVELMKPGSVVVDLAASQGGNCDVTQPGESVSHQGVTIIGYTDMTSRAASTASALYGRNLVNLIELMCEGEGFSVDPEDEVVRGALILSEGELMWPPPAVPKPEPKPVAAKAATSPPVVASAPAKPAAKADSGPATPVVIDAAPSFGPAWLVGGALAALWVWLRIGGVGQGATPELDAFLQHLTVFVLACFVGWQVIWSVTAALHTPLMSVTNAISGIIIIGGMLHTAGDLDQAHTLLGAAAVFFAAINVAGGFLVTQRMLRMFRR